MTFLDAIIAVLGVIWGALSAPAAVFIYGIVLLIVAIVMFAIAGPGAGESGFYKGASWYGVVAWWVLIPAIAICASALLVWAASSANPFTWEAA